jgi:hypothetical protein
MIAFLSRYSDMLNPVLNAAMVVIRVAYLRVFTVNHMRQARAVLHIDLGAAKGAQSRCLVTNLGFSRVYVQAILAQQSHQGHRSRTPITGKDGLDNLVTCACARRAPRAAGCCVNSPTDDLARRPITAGGFTPKLDDGSFG